MENLLFIGIAVFVAFVLLRGPVPPEPRVTQIALDPVPPAPPIGGCVLLALCVVLVLTLLGVR